MSNVTTYDFNSIGRNVWQFIVRLYARDLEWDIHVPLSLEGIPKSALVRGRTMRRKVRGQWQYRAPTDEEISDHDAGRAW